MESYFIGSDWARQTAKKALPVLVNFAENRRSTTYTELAEILIDDKAYAYPLMAALGRLGRALESLGRVEAKKLGAIPPIQLIVCNQRTRRPGNLSLGFLGVRKSVADSLKPEELNLLVRGAHQTVFDYQKWQDVLTVTGLRPRTLNLPPTEKVLPKIKEIERHKTGEGEEHKRLKLFLAEHPEKIGIGWKGSGRTEVLLLSGDRLDLSFRSADQWIAVEVKGRNSPEADLIRGIFQCLKYRAVMSAQLRYEGLSKGATFKAAVPQPILACGCGVPLGLREFAHANNVEVKSDLIVPHGFMPCKEMA